MGRPRQAAGETRGTVLGIRLTAAERAHVEHLAERAGRPDVSDFARRAILGQPIPPARDGGELAALIVALNRVGNNLNQITARLNASDELALDARDVLAEVKAVVAVVAEAAG